MRGILLSKSFLEATGLWVGCLPNTLGLLEPGVAGVLALSELNFWHVILSLERIALFEGLATLWSLNLWSIMEAQLVVVILGILEFWKLRYLSFTGVVSPSPYSIFSLSFTSEESSWYSNVLDCGFTFCILCSSSKSLLVKGSFTFGISHLKLSNTDSFKGV